MKRIFFKNKENQQNIINNTLVDISGIGLLFKLLKDNTLLVGIIGGLLFSFKSYASPEGIDFLQNIFQRGVQSQEFAFKFINCAIEKRTIDKNEMQKCVDKIEKPGDKPIILENTK